MLETGQNWELFGYDMRQLGRHWKAAWRDLLWADDSPVRERLDGVVQLRDGEGTSLYQAGKPTAPAPVEVQAILLPEELVLARRLRLPLAAESYLDSAMALEVNANSPFPAQDAGYGWRLVGRDETHLEIALVIVSISTVMTFLGRQYDAHDPLAQEVWAQVDEEMVVVNGFGEVSRASRYRKRLIRCGLGVAVAALVLLLIFALAAGAKRAELLQVEKIAADIQDQASEASAMRSSLAQANATIDAVNEIVAVLPGPHPELARLTGLLDDDVSISRFSMQGRELRVQGRAADAASVMQKLNADPGYGEVSAPQAIVKLGNTGLEQFSLNISLREGASG